jgi:hypothetical protein
MDWIRLAEDRDQWLDLESNNEPLGSINWWEILE